MRETIFPPAGFVWQTQTADRRLLPTALAILSQNPLPEPAQPARCLPDPAPPALQALCRAAILLSVRVRAKRDSSGTSSPCRFAGRLRLNPRRRAGGLLSP